MFMIVGPSEMILGSVGSIVTSLLTPVPHASSLAPLVLDVLAATTSHPHSPKRSPLQVRQKHVQILSIGNTGQSRPAFDHRSRVFLVAYLLSLF